MEFSSILVSASADLKFHYWPATGPELDLEFTPSPSGSQVVSLSLSNDAQFVCYAMGDGRIEVACARNGSGVHVVRRMVEVANVTAVSFQWLTKTVIAAGSADSHVVLYSTRLRLEAPRYLPDAPAPVNLLDFNIKDSLLAVACRDATNVIYDVGAERIVNSFGWHEAQATTAMRFHPGLEHVLTAGSADGRCIFWDCLSSKSRYSSQHHSGPVSGVVVPPTLEHLAITVGLDRHMCVQDVRMKECASRVSLPDQLTCADASGDGTLVSVGTSEGHVLLYDLRDTVRPIESSGSWRNRHAGPVTHLLFDRLHLRQRARPGKERRRLQEFLVQKKAEIVDRMARDADDLHRHFEIHMENMERFVEAELSKISEEHEDRWDSLMAAACNMDPQSVKM